MIFYIFYIFDIFQKMKISNKLYNNRCNTLMQYLMTITVTSQFCTILIISGLQFYYSSVCLLIAFCFTVDLHVPECNCLYYNLFYICGIS